MTQRVVIVGANGLLGREVLRAFDGLPGFSVFAAARSRAADVKPSEPIQWLQGIDSHDLPTTFNVLSRCNPDVIINCAGISGVAPEDQHTASLISVYCTLPHALAAWSHSRNCRFIHISSDGVFSGSEGNYRETSPVDATDVYGVTKAAGEVSLPHCLVLRTSFIGHADRGRQRLLDWAVSQKGSIQGYRNYRFTCISTIELARFIVGQLIPRTGLAGIFHVPGAQTTKFELLQRIAHIYQLSLEVKPYDLAAPVNRTLNSELLTSLTGYKPPDVEVMLGELLTTKRASSVQKE